MPVQINEMIIRANIMEQGGSPRNKVDAAPKATPGEVNKEEIIKECAALVLEMLHDKKQR